MHLKTPKTPQNARFIDNFLKKNAILFARFNYYLYICSEIVSIMERFK